MRHRGSATTIAGIYLVTAATWIVVSTLLVAVIEPQLPLSPAAAELVKGVVFVVVTATMLWVVLGRSDRRTRRVNERLRRLSDDLPMPIYVLDPVRKRLQYANPALEALASSLHLAADESLAMLSSGVHPDDVATLDISRRVRADPSSSFMVRRLAEDGRWRLLQHHEQLVHAEDGTDLLQGLIVDVTEQILREEELEGRLQEERDATRQLERLHEMQAAFLQAVSHELRTPLTVISAAAELLDRRRDELDPDTEDELRSRLVHNSSKLARLLTDLLDVDRLTRGVIRPNRRWIELRGLVERTVETMHLGDHDLTCHGGPAQANVDAAQIERVVENLVANAVRHTPPETAIDVHVHADERGSTLIVEDSGPGLPDDRDVFAPFERGETWAPSPGTGIGLTLVQRFVDLHGGTVTASRSDSGGARFVVVIPHVTDPRERGDAASPGSTSASDRGSGRSSLPVSPAIPSP